MSKQDNGGPAFLEGMTLRDYFAAQAMQAIIQVDETSAPTQSKHCDDAAKRSYGFADAMLAARAAPDTTDADPIAAENAALRERVARLEEAVSILRQMQLADDRQAEPVLRAEIDAFLARATLENTDG